MAQTEQVSITAEMLKTLTEWKLSALDDRDLPIDGRSLTISTLAAIASRKLYKLRISDASHKDMNENHSFLEGLMSKGTVIYGINTGFGGSADVRCPDVGAIQKSLIAHLNAGFGETLDAKVVRGAMAVRVNSLSLAYSGVRAEVVQLLCDMIRCDVIPVVPMRGSVSASGDLMPLSYVAACMSGRKDGKVIMNGETITTEEAFRRADLKFVEFQAKEGLAVINSSSVASSLAADVLFDASVAHLLTQIVTALCMEGLHGKMESFNEMIHNCLPHAGNKEVASNVRTLLQNSNFVQHDMEWKVIDSVGSLKQDRYALRTAAQWIGPSMEIWRDSVRRVNVELNSANDNPLIDHRTKEVMHCGNFQGTSCTVAMDQARQGIQLCGRLIFAQLSEVLNHTMGHGLPPNLSGCDVSVDFGFKGVDTATASYISELNHLTSPLTSHVLSAEMHNQSVNSLALISARTTKTALTLLHMILTNALAALCQAVDLRWLKNKVQQVYEGILKKYNLSQKCDASQLPCPWYDLAFTPRKAVDIIFHQPNNNNGYHHVMFDEFVNQMNSLTSDLSNGKHISEVARNMGKGTGLIYLYVRQTLEIPFHNGTITLDVPLAKIYDAVKQRNFVDVILEAFSN